MSGSARRKLALITLGIVSIAAMGGIMPAAAAPGVVGSFEIDGDLADTAAGEPRDWDTIDQDPDAIVLPFVDDSGQGDDSFGNGSKLLQPSTWSFVTQKVPQKDDILTGGVAIREIAGQNWLYLYSQRQFDKGSAFIGYEFNRSSETFDNDQNPATPAVPVRTANDLLIFLQINNGGTSTTIDVYEWNGDRSAGTWDPVVGIAPVRGVDWEATTGLLPGGTFLLSEAAINLDVFDQTPSCPGLGKVWMHTISSHVFNTATMKDRTIRQDIDLTNCGSITIDKIDDIEQQPLDGAVFEVRLDNGDGTYQEGLDLPVGTCTTGSAGTPGRCVFSDLAVGVYWVVEVDAPAGYDPDPTVFGPINLEPNEHELIGEPFVNRKLLPRFEVAKSVSPASVNLSDGDTSNDTVTYSITVTNVGDGEGSTSVVDDFDQDHLTDVTLGTPGGTNDGNEITWSDSGIIAPNGGTATFTYTARVTGTYTSEDQGPDCEGATQYPVVNLVEVEGDDASATVCVNAEPAFSVEKTADKNIAQLGEEVTYTITVTNDGPGVGSTSVVDDYDEDHLVDVDGVTPADGTVDGGLITWSDSGPIAPNGGTATFSYTGTIAGTFTGSSGAEGCDSGEYPVINVVTVEGDTGSKTVCVPADPSFVVSKSVSPSSVDLSDGDTSNDTVTYSITVTNTGAAEGSTSVVDDYDEAHLTDLVLVSPGSDESGVITWSSGVLAPNGGSATFTYTARVTGDYTGATGGSGCDAGQYPVVNLVTVDGDDDSATVCVTADPSFVVSKSVSPSSVDLSDGDTSNDTVTYSITVTNAGAAEGSTSVVDDYDEAHLTDLVLVSPGSDESGVITWSSGVLAPNGGSATFTYTARVIGPFTDDEAGEPCESSSFPVVNLVTVDGDSATATICAAAVPRWEVTKSADPSSVDLSDGVTANDVVTYTIEVTNVGQAEGSTAVVDDYDQDHLVEIGVITPADGQQQGGTIVWGSGPIEAGASKSFSYTGRIVGPFTGDDAGEPCSQGTYPVVNIVTVDGDEAQATVCAGAEPLFTVVKEADPATVDLSDGDVANDTVTYTITVTNGGEAEGSTQVVDDYDQEHLTDIGGITPADGVLGPDTIEWLSAPIAPHGGTATFSYTARVIGPFASSEAGDGCDAGTFPVVNEVSVSGDSARSVVCAGASPKLTVSKIADKTVAHLGEEVTYTITVENIGEGPGSTGVSDDYDQQHLGGITGITPATGLDNGDTIHWSDSGVIEPEASVAFSYTGTLQGTFAGPDGQGGCGTGTFPVVNLVSIDGDEDSNTVCVPAQPNFTVTKSASPETIDLSDGDPTNDVVTYTILVENIGQAQGSVLVVDDYDQQHLTDLTTDGDTSDGDTVVWDSGIIPAGQSRTFTYTARIEGPFTSAEAGPGCDGENGFPVINFVELRTDDGVADSDSVTVCVHAEPRFEVTKTADPVTVDLSDGDDTNDRVTYTITVTNVGEGPGSTEVGDDYDEDHLIEIGGITPADGVDDGSGVLWADSGVIEPSASASFVFSGRIVGPFLADEQGEPCPEGVPIVNTVDVNGASDDAVVCVIVAPDLGLIKSVRNVNDGGDFGPTATADPAETMEYRILVTNGGDVEATGVVVTDPVPHKSTFVSCEPMLACGSDGGIVTWSVGSVPVGAEITLTFQVTLDETFEPGFTLIGNIASGTRDGGDAPTASTPTTLTVTEVSKSICLTNPVPGASITYTIPYGARGGAVSGVVLEDVLPDGVEYESASPEPVSAPPVGGTGTVRWEFGTLEDGTDSFATVTGRISPEAQPGDVLANEVKLSAAGVPETTFTLETLVVDGGDADARARGLSLDLLGTQIVDPTPDSAEQNPDQALDLDDPVSGEIAQVDVLAVQHARSVDQTDARANAIATTGEIKLLDQLAGPGEDWLITATAVRASSASSADLASAGSSSAGSMLVNVTVDGQNLGTVTEPTEIEIVDPVLGTTTKIGLLEHVRTGAADGIMQPVGGVFSSGLSVTAIHVLVTDADGDVVTDLKVAQADSDASFLSGLACGENVPHVAGTGFALGTTLDEDVLDESGTLYQGEVARVTIPSQGGHEEATAERTGPISVAGTFVGSSDTAFTRSTGTTSRDDNTAATDTHAQINGLRLLGDGPDEALVSADTIWATAHAHDGPDGSQTEGTAVLENLVIAGVDVCEALGLEDACRPAPGESLSVPGLLVVLNEQIPGEESFTVNAIRLVVLGDGNPLGLPIGTEIVIASAHAAAHAVDLEPPVVAEGPARVGGRPVPVEADGISARAGTPKATGGAASSDPAGLVLEQRSSAVLPEKPDLGFGL